MLDRPGTRPVHPLDHLPARSRYVAVDHRGRVTALVAHGPEDGAPTTTVLDGHPCDGDCGGTCDDCLHGPDHFGSTGGSVTDKSWDGAASRFNDDQYKNAAAGCDPDSGDTEGTVKQRCFLPHHEPDGTVNSNGVHAAAQRVSALKGHDAGAVERAKAHLRSHYTKDLKEDPPKSIGGDASAAPEDPFAGTCTCGHDGCSGDPVEGVCDLCDGCIRSMALAAECSLEDVIDQLYALAGAEHPPFTGTHTHEHSAMGSQGGDERHSHEHSHDGDSVHGHSHGTAMLPTDPFTSKELRDLMANNGIVDNVTADGGPDLPKIVTSPGGKWHAYTHVEGIRTDDGREIAMGATNFPDLPVSLRYLVADEGGHWGAVTCGRIDTMEMVEVNGITACLATGVFSSDEPGQLAQLAVEEQTQRFVSIDPRDVDGEYIEVQVTTGGLFDIIGDDPSDGIYDGWFRMTSFVVGAVTIVPIPALQQAVITMADQDLPMAPLATERAQQLPVIVASGAPAEWPSEPPAEWFSTPPPTVGDPRLVRQPDGKYAVPFTITEDGHVYGHACYWGQRHTGFPNQKVPPPRSSTYAHFMTGERVVILPDGSKERVAVGKVTMGCGHASTSLGHTAAKAHYDGGYGAVQVADVRAIEDDFGIWLSGAICPAWSERNPDGPTPEQVAQLMSLDISPDWRKIGGTLLMMAALAVPVGGFPIARESLVASGLTGIDADAAGVVRAHYDGEEVVSLVAAGRVRRRSHNEQLRDLAEVVFGPDLSELIMEHRRAKARARLSALVDDL